MNGRTEIIVFLQQPSPAKRQRLASSPPVVVLSSEEEVAEVNSDNDGDEDDNDEYEYELDPQLNEAPVAAAAMGHTLPAELMEQVEQPFDEDSEEDNTHIGQWRAADLGTLALAINFHREDLKGKFVGASGGTERRKKAWQAVAGKSN